MASVNFNSPDVLNAATLLNAQNVATAQKKEELSKSQKTRKSPFTSAMEQAKEESEPRSARLPPETAGLSTEDAVIYLKDQADIAADQLRDHITPENYRSYREKISHFMKFIARNNYKVEMHKSIVKNPKTKKFLDPKMTITVIDKTLEDMAHWLLSSQKDTINMLKKINEIQGLIVDLMN